MSNTTTNINEKLNQINKLQLYKTYLKQRRQLKLSLIEIQKLTDENKRLRQIAIKQKRVIQKQKDINLVNSLSEKLGKQDYQQTYTDDNLKHFKETYDTRIINGMNYYISMLQDTNIQFIYEIIDTEPMYAMQSVGRILGWLENQVPNFN